MADIYAIRSHEPEPILVRTLKDGILHLELNNPPANALSMAMMEALQSALDEAETERAVRVVVIGARGKLFSAGHDLKEMTGHRTDPDRGRAFFDTTMQACSRLMQSVVRHPKPVIAAIDGTATAAGCQLVASCDLAIASDRASFGVNGIDVGLFCSTPMVALSRKISRKHAMEMLLTGEIVDAPTAREFGLVNRVVPSEYLNQTVMKFAETIAAKSSSALRIGKEAFYRQAEMGLADAYGYTAGVMVENMLFHDAEEGIAAFIEKRKPEWTDE
jgi:enoyl-CoA hydratase/carnithine racemase